MKKSKQDEKKLMETENDGYSRSNATPTENQNDDSGLNQLYKNEANNEEPPLRLDAIRTNGNQPLIFKLKLGQGNRLPINEDALIKNQGND